MIRDDMTFSVYLFQPLSPPWAFTIPALLVKKKKKNLHEPFQTVTFHHDARDSHIPGLNFLEFLVYALSITSYHC